MTNATSYLTYRSYPYTPAFWQDFDGRWRWTLTTKSSAVLSAILAIIIAMGIGRLVAIVYTIMHMTVILRISRTMIDDQVNVIAANTEEPTSLLGYLFRFCWTVRRRMLRSRVLYIVFLIGTLFLVAQIVISFMLGRLVLNGPVPYSPGRCGYATQNLVKGPLEAQLLSSYYFHTALLYEQMASLFSSCVDGGDKITCPGPYGQNFSWEVMESEPGYCWFGETHCYNNSKTLAQKATMVPADMGVVGKTRTTVTVTAECSHVNNTMFIGYGFDPSVNDNFTAYQFGTSNYLSISRLYYNDTLLIYDEDLRLFIPYYRPEYDIYNGVPGNDWIPAEFLLDGLDRPFIIDNVTGPATLLLFFSRLYGIWSIFENNDPLFLTETTPVFNDSPQYANLTVYAPGRNIATVACRDRFELQISSPDDPPGSEPWVTVGSWPEVTAAYNASFNTGRPLVGFNELDSEMALWEWAFFWGSVFAGPLQGLGGSILNAQKTVYLGSQEAPAENLTTRAEVTRWFGVQMLYTLYIAQQLTSGTLNDAGEGITIYPDDVWWCCNTLRISQEYVSFYVIPLVVILVTVLAVTAFSFSLRPLLWAIVDRIHESRVSQSIRKALVSQQLHGNLQLHRLVAESSTSQRFTQTLWQIPIVGSSDPEDLSYCGRAPNYAVTRMPADLVDELQGEDKGDEEEKKPFLIATILQNNELREAVFEYNDVI